MAIQSSLNNQCLISALTDLLLFLNGVVKHSAMFWEITASVELKRTVKVVTLKISTRVTAQKLMENLMASSILPQF